MSKIVGLFSGQGSQYSGMGRELYEKHKEAKEIYQCCEDIVGMKISDISFNGSEEALSQTLVAQPAIFTLSVAAYTVSKNYMPKLSAVSGHSLGEFAALYAAGAFSLEDGFRIIKERAKAMDKASKNAKGAMVAVLKAPLADIERVCEETSGLVLPVNLNLPEQTVISGEEGPVMAAAKALQDGGARIARLGVSSGFHTPLMREAGEEFRDAVKNIRYSKTKIPFYSNLTGSRLEIEDYPEYFFQHMISPVRFVEQVAAMSRDGITTAVEFGPKRTVATLVKKNNKEIQTFSVEDEKGLEALKEIV